MSNRGNPFIDELNRERKIAYREFAESIRAVVQSLVDEELSLSEIAKQLNSKHIKPFAAGRWTKIMVSTVIAKLRIR